MTTGDGSRRLARLLARAESRMREAVGASDSVEDSHDGDDLRQSSAAESDGASKTSTCVEEPLIDGVLFAEPWHHESWASLFVLITNT